MDIHSIEFKGSFAREGDCPQNSWVEYAFIGRSNVGKSSLLNMLGGRNALAHVSSTPGKTQVINFFLVNESWYLVDLPGYGYAKVSKKKRNLFKDMIRNYFRKREMLCCAFVLIDCNIKPQETDLAFIRDLGEHEVPFAIVYTKADKSKKEEVDQNIELFRTEMKREWAEMPKEFITSSTKNIGREDILNFIESINQEVSKTT